MKFRVFPLGVLYVIIYSILAIIFFGLVILVPSEKELWVWVVISFIFVLSIVIIIYILGFSLDFIVIDHESIKKYHHGKLKKTLKWNEIITFEVYPKNNSFGWIYLSNLDIEYNFLTSTFMMYDKKSICFPFSEIVMKELQKYLKH